jgi:hypothetical protein
MEIWDVRNKMITKGAMVRYVGTHTRGKVDRIRIKNGVHWMRIDSTGLYYRAEYLEVIDWVENKKELKSHREVNRNIALSKGLKRATSTQISDHPDGPGYGGG